MVVEHEFSPLLQHLERDPKALVCLLGAGDRLKQQIDWRAPIERCQLSRNVSQTARLRRNLVGSDQPLQRSEEHTSELQSHLNLVCRLLLEKKKKNHSTNRRRSS